MPAILKGPAKATIPIKVLIAGSKTASKLIISNLCTVTTRNYFLESQVKLFRHFLADLLINIELSCVFLRRYSF